MGTRSISPSPSPLPSDLPTTATDSSGIDRQTKKRMQNRVAQRTYRKLRHISHMCGQAHVFTGTRIKQRLRDLQQQVNILQKKEEGQQYGVRQREFGADDGGNEGISSYGPPTGDLAVTPVLDHDKDLPNIEVPYQDIPELKTTGSGAWPSQTNTWHSSLRPTSFAYNNSFNIPARPLLESASGASMQASSPRHLPMNLSGNMDGLQAYYREHQRDTQEFSQGVEQNSQQHILNSTSNPIGK